MVDGHLGSGTWWSEMPPGRAPSHCWRCRDLALAWSWTLGETGARSWCCGGWHILKALYAPGSALSAVGASSHQTLTISPCDFYDTCVLPRVELSSCQTWWRISLWSELHQTRKQKTPSYLGCDSADRLASKQNQYKSVLSHFSRVWLFATPWTVAHQALLSKEFSMHEWLVRKCFKACLSELIENIWAKQNRNVMWTVRTCRAATYFN